MRKVIVIGLDGLEPTVVESMFKAGELPNLRALADQGRYTRLRTTYPAQTPVAWSTFSTGVNPGGHGIFDFLTRDPATYLPLLALSRYEQKNPFVPPKVVNGRRGVPMWQLLSDAGIPSTVLRCPCTYPPDEIRGRMLAGVGVPDLRGGLGTSTFYSTAAGLVQEHSERVIQLNASGSGVFDTYLVGPRHPKTRADMQLKVTLAVTSAARSATLHSSGQPNVLNLRAGEWSDWLRVKFKLGLLQSVRGMVRFLLVRTEPHIDLYASPINFDPDAPLFPITSPADYAKELQGRLGPFYTLGMAEEHDGLNNGRIDEAAYLAQCNIVLAERTEMLHHELARFDRGLLFCLFDTPDRLQHMFWRFREPDHPANRAGFDAELARVVEDHYAELDRIVGDAMAHVDDETLFVVLSDHGMNSFRRGVNLNTWLYQQGFLSLAPGVRPGEETGDFFQNVDWNATRAYALGLGGIFLNLRGREANGVVAAGEAGSVAEAIAQGLTGLRDPADGAVAIRSVSTRQELYRGAYAAEAPDLLVNFAPRYRVSWDTPLGGVAADLFQDNLKRWAGDHVIDPPLAPGVLFMNRTFRQDQPSLVDLAPTILASLNSPVGSAMEGKNLLQ